ncbi:MAG: nucleolar and coiled-body phosphoprotein 1 [Icmadophila ericetorum]|nr:nucleolar and coiled-body phosphoprotein 1 [Icmadophila ericetorum]
MSFVFVLTTAGVVQRVPKKPILRLSYDSDDLPIHGTRVDCHITEPEHYQVTQLQNQGQDWSAMISALYDRRLAAENNASEDSAHRSSLAEENEVMLDADSDGEDIGEADPMEGLEIELPRSQVHAAQEECIMSDLPSLSEVDEALVDEPNEIKAIFNSEENHAAREHITIRANDIAEAIETAQSVHGASYTNTQCSTTNDNENAQNEAPYENNDKSQQPNATQVYATADEHLQSEDPSRIDLDNRERDLHDESDSDPDEEAPDGNPPKVTITNIENLTEDFSSPLSSLTPEPEPVHGYKASNAGSKRRLWTAEEKKTLVDSQAAGLTWPEIAKIVGNGRSAHACTTQWSTMRKHGKLEEDKLAKGMKERWSEEDDEKLMKAHEEGKEMKDILKEFPGRSTIGALYARLNKLKEQLVKEEPPEVAEGGRRTRKKWTKDEETRLIALLRKAAAVTEIQAAFPHRNGPALKKKCVELRAREKIPPAKSILNQNIYNSLLSSQNVPPSGASLSELGTTNTQSNTGLSANAGLENNPLAEDNITNTPVQQRARKARQAQNSCLDTTTNEDPQTGILPEDAPAPAPAAPIRPQTRKVAQTQDCTPNSAPTEEMEATSLVQRRTRKAAKSQISAPYPALGADSQAKYTLVKPALQKTASVRGPTARVTRARETSVNPSATNNPYARVYNTITTSRRIQHTDTSLAETPALDTIYTETSLPDIDSTKPTQSANETTANPRSPQKLRLNPPRPPAELVENMNDINDQVPAARIKIKLNLNPPKPVTGAKEKPSESLIPQSTKGFSQNEMDKMIELEKQGLGIAAMAKNFPGHTKKCVCQQLKRLKEVMLEDLKDIHQAQEPVESEPVAKPKARGRPPKSSGKQQDEIPVESEPVAKPKPRGRPKGSGKSNSMLTSATITRTHIIGETAKTKESSSESVNNSNAQATSQKLDLYQEAKQKDVGTQTRAQKRKAAIASPTDQIMDAPSITEPTNKRQKVAAPEFPDVGVSAAGKRKRRKASTEDKIIVASKTTNAAEAPRPKRQKTAATKPSGAVERNVEGPKENDAAESPKPSTKAQKAKEAQSATEDSEGPKSKIASKQPKPSAKAPAPKLPSRGKTTDKDGDMSSDEDDSEDEISARVTEPDATKRFKKDAAKQSAPAAAAIAKPPEAPVAPRAGAVTRRHAAAANIAIEKIPTEPTKSKVPVKSGEPKPKPKPKPQPKKKSKAKGKGGSGPKEEIGAYKNHFPKYEGDFRIAKPWEGEVGYKGIGVRERTEMPDWKRKEQLKHDEPGLRAKFGNNYLAKMPHDHYGDHMGPRKELVKGWPTDICPLSEWKRRSLKRREEEDEWKPEGTTDVNARIQTRRQRLANTEKILETKAAETKNVEPYSLESPSIPTVRELDPRNLFLAEGEHDEMMEYWEDGRRHCQREFEECVRKRKAVLKPSCYGAAAAGVVWAANAVRKVDLKPAYYEAAAIGAVRTTKAFLKDIFKEVATAAAGKLGATASVQ